MFSKSSLRKVISYMAVVLVFLLIFTWPLDYIVFMPGRALELYDMVSVPDKKESTGSFMMTVVLSQQANIPLYIRGLLSPSMDIYPLNEVMPQSIGSDEYHQLMLQSMQNSQLVASALALRQSGYEVPEMGEGVLIVSVNPDSKAVDLLREGDILTYCAGREIALREQLAESLIDKKPGDTVDIRVQRAEEELAFEVELIPKADDPEVAGIGVMAATYRWNLDMPFEVTVHSEDIGGSSAGLMMTLEIMNQLSAEDLTHGRRIAGTGTINLNGDVGAIGGVRQKVMGAIDNKAEFFFAPHENYADARDAAENKLTVVEVAYLDDALAFLRSLG